jgi:hypothetical protein
VQTLIVAKLPANSYSKCEVSQTRFCGGYRDICLCNLYMEISKIVNIDQDGLNLKGKRWVEVIISNLYLYGIDFTPFLVLVSIRSTTMVLYYYYSSRSEIIYNK